MIYCKAIQYNVFFLHIAKYLLLFFVLFRKKLMIT